MLDPTIDKFVTFVVPCLSDLRYLVPFSVALHRSIPGLKQVFDVQRWSSKYNGLADPSNFERCLAIIAMYPWIIIASPVASPYVVQVETGSAIETPKRISIQHGFDCAFLSRELSNVDVYVCGSRMMFEFANRYEIPGAVLAPGPVPFWDPRSNEQPSGIVTVFYPDKGDVDTADAVIQQLQSAGRVVMVKQRRKHQSIRAGGTHVYDDIWYPPEGITLPSTSDFTVGFGSSAYTDLVPAGLAYVNIDVHDAFPWNVFDHPASGNYVRVTDVGLIAENIERALATFKRVAPISVGDEHIREFMLELFHACDDNG